MQAKGPSDRDLVRLHWPVSLRPAFDALLGIDDAMADVVLRGRDPALAAIKLAWWRERLQALDHEAPPPEPRLQAAKRRLISRGLDGQRLAEIEDGWLPLLEPALDRAAALQRGEIVFRSMTSLLGVSGDVADAGRLWAAADLARRTGDPTWLDQSPASLPRSPRSLRPLTALTALAARDQRRGRLEPEGTPARAWALLRHRVTGRL